MSCLCDIFFIFIFIIINIISLNRHNCFLAHALEYALLLRMVTWLKKSNNFQIIDVHHQGLA